MAMVRVFSILKCVNKLLVFLIVLGIIALILILDNCIKSSRLSESATSDDFNGVWIGKLSKNYCEYKGYSEIIINDFVVHYSNLPIRNNQGKIIFMSGSTSCEYRKTYSIDSPCVVINCNYNEGSIFPIYLYYNKRIIYYPISPGSGMYMNLQKQ